MNWNVPKIWDGGDVWIIGGGPSVTKLFGIPDEVVEQVRQGKLSESAYSPYMKFLHDKHVIGINVAYRIGDWIDMVFFGDSRFMIEYKNELASWSGMKVSCAPAARKFDWVRVLERDKSSRRGISESSDNVAWNGNSGAAAISVAVHLGAKRIFLLGFDMKLGKNQSQHWHGAYIKKKKSQNIKVRKLPFHKHLMGFPNIAADAKRLGVEIYNVCPDSAITCLPKITLDEAIRINKNIKNTPISVPVVKPEKSFTRMKGKICITTTFDINYKEGGKTLFNSIRRHTDCTGIDFKVITSDRKVLNEFGKENCHFVNKKIRDRYKNVVYYKDLPKERYESSWHRFEMFNMTDYDRVICIDSDCITLEDISYLFSEELNEYDLISVEDYIVSMSFTKSVPQLTAVGLDLTGMMERREKGEIDIQPAVLVANKSILDGKWYRKLLKFANTSPFIYAIDEGILNTFIYKEHLKIKILPLEWDYQDVYETHIPELPVPTHPIIVHCQQSKPFKKEKSQIDQRLIRWHDRWWEESKPIKLKTFVVILVWNRFENLKRWINCWNQCDKTDAELVVIHNQESDNQKYQDLCKDNGVLYVPRENTGFDIGAFQDVCKERLANFPNAWDNLIWVTDDCIPMAKDFVGQFLSKLTNTNIPCYEISDLVKRHVRTTGFLVTKNISKRLIFPIDPIHDREDCYQFEHKSKNSLYEQLVKMGKTPVMVSKDLKTSPLWDSHVRRQLGLMKKHEEVFVPIIETPVNVVGNSVLDEIAIKHKADKSSYFNNFAVKYDKILAPFRFSYKSILEIGISHGNSLCMWVDYFPNAVIHGVDIPDAIKYGVNLKIALKKCKDYSDKIKFHMVDQSDEAQLKNLEQFSPFDFIVDDGSHYWGDQILTFQTLFPYLRKGGIYIVEDTCTSYWKEYNKNNSISCVEYFKKLVDEVNFNGARGSVPKNPPKEFGGWEKGWHRREDCFESVPLFESIQFMNGFIVIYKR